jgi:hypothetical protein
MTVSGMVLQPSLIWTLPPALIAVQALGHISIAVGASGSS